MLTLFKSKKGKEKIVKMTPKIAHKIAKNVIPKSPTFIDCLIDIEARANRGYTWTYMLQVEEETIIKLKEEGWDIRNVNKNESNDTYLIRINW